MDYRELYAAYERREAAGEASAKQLFQLVVFGFMSGYYSLRSISAACRCDVRMMYLLQGEKAPSHEHLRDFIRNRLTGNVMEMFLEFADIFFNVFSFLTKVNIPTF